MQKRLIVGAAIVALMSPFAGAQAADGDLSGWYGQISAGALQLRDNDGSISGTSVDVDYELGWTITGAVGYGFGNGFRAELELGYGNSGFDSVNIGGTKANVKGDIDLGSAYAAGYYEFNTGVVRPYLGGGLGLVYSHVSNASVTVGGVTFTGDDDDDIALSAFGEVGFAVNISRGWAIVPSVRFLWVDNGSSGFDDDTAWVGRIGLRFQL